MDIKTLKKYLEDLLSLESEKYRLEEIKKTLLKDKTDKEIKLNSPNAEKDRLAIEREQKKEAFKNEIITKNNEAKSINLGAEAGPLYFVAFIVSFILMSIIKAILGIEDGSTMVYILILLSIVAPIIFVIKIQKPDKERKKLLEQEVKNLEKNYYDKVQELYVDYKKLEEKSETDFKLYKEQLILSCKNDEESIKKIDEIYLETTNILEELYSANIIFDKYRNLAAITMFFEYFSSSRVFELEGKDGAYNLYESELRQNLIINNLNKINDNLEQIKDNQYCMYNELKNINSSLEIINKNLIEGLTDITMLEMANLAINTEIAKNLKTIKNIQVHDYIMY